MKKLKVFFQNVSRKSLSVALNFLKNPLSGRGLQINYRGTASSCPTACRESPLLYLYV